MRQSAFISATPPRDRSLFALAVDSPAILPLNVKRAGEGGVEDRPNKVSVVDAPPSSAEGPREASFRVRDVRHTRHIAESVHPPHRAVTSKVYASKGGCIEPVYNAEGHIIAGTCVHPVCVGIAGGVVIKAPAGGTQEFWRHAAIHGVHQAERRVTVANAPIGPQDTADVNSAFCAAACESNIPLEAAERPWFTLLTKILRPGAVIGNHKYVMDHYLRPVFAKVFAATAEELRQLPFFSIQADFWGGAGAEVPEYLGLVGAAVHPDEWARWVRPLGVRRILDHKTADRAHFATISILKEAENPFGPRCVSVAADGAMSAFLDKFEGAFHETCAAHTINLANDTLFHKKNGDKMALACLDAVHSVMVDFTTRSVWASKLLVAELDIMDCALDAVVDIKNRWYSRLHMFQRFLEIYPSILRSLATLSSEGEKDADTYLKTLAPIALIIPYLCAVLEPLYTASVGLEADNSMASQVLPTVATLEHRLLVMFCECFPM